MPMPTTDAAPPHHRIDPDFAEDILAEIYAYPHKRRWVALLLWGTLGWFGAHRFYLLRTGTAALMTITLGGALIWWFTDLFRIRRMVVEFNEEQERRRAEGLPPIDLAFMPPLERDVLAQPPEWTQRWQRAGGFVRFTRLAGDILVLLIVGVSLGAVAKAADVWEAIIAVVVLVALTAAGGTVGAFGHLPAVHQLIRWSHRLRLFYYYTNPGSAGVLLLRPITAALLAPFRRRARAEVRLYLQLGVIFTVLFVLYDFGGEVFDALLGRGFPSLADLFGIWLKEAILTFIVIFAFATPIGAVLNKHLLMNRTHTLTRVLGVGVLAAVLLGVLA
jgi:hypothetical protein